MKTNDLKACYAPIEPKLVTVTLPDLMSEILVLILKDLLTKFHPQDPDLAKHYVNTCIIADKLNNSNVLHRQDVITLLELLQIYQARCVIMILDHDLKDECESDREGLEYNSMEPKLLCNTKHKTILYSVDTSLLEAAVNIMSKIRNVLHPTHIIDPNYFEDYDGSQ